MSRPETLAARPGQRGETPRRILVAALASFSSRGYLATSLDGLAAELGIRKQTILYYHPSKQALLAAVVDGVVDDLVAGLSEAFASAPAGVDRPAVVVDAVLRLGADRPELLALLWEGVRLGPPVANRLAHGLEPLADRVVDELLAGQPRGAARRARVRAAVMAVAARVVGLGVEVQLRRSMGLDPGLAWLRRRRADLLAELRAALG